VNTKRLIDKLFEQEARSSNVYGIFYMPGLYGEGYAYFADKQGEVIKAFLQDMEEKLTPVIGYSPDLTSNPSKSFWAMVDQGSVGFIEIPGKHKMFISKSLNPKIPVEFKARVQDDLPLTPEDEVFWSKSGESNPTPIKAGQAVFGNMKPVVSKSGSRGSPGKTEYYWGPGQSELDEPKMKDLERDIERRAKEMSGVNPRATQKDLPSNPPAREESPLSAKDDTFYQRYLKRFKGSRKSGKRSSVESKVSSGKLKVIEEAQDFLDDNPDKPAAYTPLIIELIDAKDKRNWRDLPASFEFDAVQAAFREIKNLFPRQAVSQRIRASRAMTFEDLRSAVLDALRKHRPDLLPT